MHALKSLVLLGVALTSELISVLTTNPILPEFSMRFIYREFHETVVVSEKIVTFNYTMEHLSLSLLERLQRADEEPVAIAPPECDPQPGLAVHDHCDNERADKMKEIATMLKDQTKADEKNMDDLSLKLMGK